MRQTLFTIPHFLFEGPLLVIWLVIGAAVLAWLFKKHGSTSETWSFLPIYAFVAVLIHFVFPGLEVDGINPDDPTGPLIKTGMAVRGYGLFMLGGIIAGIGVTLVRAKRIGITADQIIGLGFWMMVAGIVGARAFYVLQKPEEFSGAGTPIEKLVQIVNMTRGGLVVYGSLIGGVIAAGVYLFIHRLPPLKVADLIAPGMVLGLAIGRLGCLMNGCCFGGVCTAEVPAIKFPPGSAPYMQQLSRGELLGIDAESIDGDLVAVGAVIDGSLADQQGIQPGDKVRVYFPDSLLIRFRKSHPDSEISESDQLVCYVDSDRQGRLLFPIDDLPDLSRRTHPTQIYSSINAGLLFLTLWFFWTVRKADGQVFALMLILYPIGRFLIEIIRRDEGGQFGTVLTISQWVSLVTILCGFALFSIAMTRRPDPSVGSTV